ncbi:MAG: peptidase inhibitor family I36 protein [Pseudobdellovibrionaceae bacterium]|nr:peptidase inhibitor family I36 protein [Pseudobdellovibrionaceae bacterium]
MQRHKIIATGLFFVLAIGCGSENASHESELNAYSDCPGGNICFFNGPGGTGKMCSWREHDEDWTSGGSVCSWATDMNVKSVINNTAWRIEYFKKPGYKDRVGSTHSGVQGNLAGTYKLGSHRKVR